MAGIVNEAYTLDVNAQEAGAAEASVNVRAWDSTSPTPVQRINKTTDANGDITSTIITAEIHSITGTSTRATTILNPIKIRALKWTLNIEEISINLGAPSAQTFFMSVNPNITESNQTTVNGYIGFSINDTLGTILLDNAPWDKNRLYDRVQSVSIDSPAESVANGQAVETVDGTNYTLRYDMTIENFTFDGLGASYTGSNWTLQTDGSVQNVTITGDVTITTDVANLTDVTINGNVVCDISTLPISLSWTNVTVTGDVTNNSTGALTINAVNSSITTSEPGTGGGQVNIVQSAQVELTGLVIGSEVRAYVGTNPATSVEIAGIEAVVSSTFAFAQSEAGNSGYIRIVKEDQEDVFLPITYSAADQSIPIQQRFDRNFNNPP